ncbi:MAG: thioredoxin domain-containing protein, partial [Verrucomicrobiota bacterium]
MVTGVLQRMENALAGEKSPYLLQHKNNPVEWRPWGEAAFAQARAEQKPVFLSIGYSTCHWCHVMAHESFENPAIAALMNRAFVNIKVDREERPDVDRVYMAFVQATSGGGGWPMSVWLTPEGNPFFGGTYFPPEDRYGRAGFPQIVLQIEKLWDEDPARIEAEAGRVMGELRGAAAPVSSGEPLQSEWILNGQSAFARGFDAHNGGFGGAPKFPRPSVLSFLLRGSEEPQRMALETLRAMSRGGMRDHLGGGFHRYSVDAFWHVPHFEKMLYDQAQIAVSLVEAWQITKDPFFESTLRSTLDYVLRDMTHPKGGFYSAEDADSLISAGSAEHAEGAFYVWTKQEIEDALGASAAGEF